MRPLILLVLACMATAATAQIYTWKDADGITHYSDQPPRGDGSRYKTLEVPPSPRPLEREGRVSEPRMERPRAPEAAVDDKQSKCQKARADLVAFENRPRRTAVGKGGKFHAVDGEERAAEEVALKKAIDEACR